MRRRLIAILAAAVLPLAPVAAATPAPELPPAGAVVIMVWQSNGLTVVPVAHAVIPPVACSPTVAP